MMALLSMPPLQIDDPGAAKRPPQCLRHPREATYDVLVCFDGRRIPRALPQIPGKPPVAAPAQDME